MPDFDLKEQLPLLYELQQIDTEILAAHQKLKSVPTKIKRLEDSFQIHRQKLEEKKEQLANVEREQRSKTGALEMQREQRGKYQAQLREVKTNKEYQALDQQISHIADKEVEIEDQILESMLQIDQLKEELNQQQKAFDVARAKNNGEKTQCEKEAESLKAKIAAYQQKSRKFHPKVHPNLMNSYREWFKRQRTGFISLVTNNVCSHCHITLPPQTVQEARKNEQIIKCASCQRILYVPLSPPEAVSSD